MSDEKEKRSPEQVIAQEIANARVRYSSTPPRERVLPSDRRLAAKITNALRAEGWRILR